MYKNVSPRVRRAIHLELGQVLTALKSLEQSLYNENIQTVGGNYLINNLIAKGVGDARVDAVAEAAAYVMREKGLDLMGFSSHGRGCIVLGKGDVPMIAVGTEYWGNEDPRDSFALYSDMIRRTRGATKNVVYGDSIASILKRTDPEVFDSNKYTFHEDEFVRILVESHISVNNYRKLSTIDYSLESGPSEELFKLMSQSTTGIIDARSVASLNTWFTDIKNKLDDNASKSTTRDEIKANMAQGSVCIISMNFHPQNHSNFSDTTLYGFPGRRYAVLVIRPNEFNVKQVVSRRYVNSISEIEQEYPHIASAVQLRRVEKDHPFRFENGYSEAYGCIGLMFYSTTSKRLTSGTDVLFRTPAVIFPEKMHIEKGIVPVTPAEPVFASTIPTLDF